jgi:hypothetical protein
MPGCRLISTVERRIDKRLDPGYHTLESSSLESPSISLVCRQFCPVHSRQDRIHRAPRINRGLSPQSKNALRFSGRTSSLHDSTTSPAPFAAPGMATCVPWPSKTTPKLTSLLPVGGRDPPAYITTCRTEDGGDKCSRRLVCQNTSPLAITWPRKRTSAKVD